MSPTPGVGLVGCGLIGQKRLSSLPPGTVRVACDLDLERARRLAAQTPGCQATDSLTHALACSEVEVVMVATVNSALAPLACQAAAAGKHVLIEKPVGISVQQINELEQIASAKGVLVRAAYNHRYHPACLKALELWREGALGPIMFIRGRYGQGGRLGYEKEWRADPKLSGGGELIDQGVHLIDLAGIFLGDFATIEGHTATYFWNMPVDDNAFLSLRNEQGATAWLHVSCTEWKNLFSLEIYGRNAKLHWEGLGGSYGLERLHFYKMLPQMGPPESTVFEFPRGDESWKLEMDEFFEDIRLHRTPMPGLKEAKAVMQVVETVYEKRKSGKRESENEARKSGKRKSGKAETG
ncbi:MAG TPA: Gfo/Idh/MocA family oxidoreductase [Verrucomicrobiae bacterium]|nr:Gfo/Idh/MocA family oxidoreductase [Verrucomicrobiae bacterium]